MRKALTSNEPITTQALEVKGNLLPSHFDYDARRPGPSDLPMLASAQVRVLLDRIVVPNLADVRKWGKQIVKIAATLQDELKRSESDPTYNGNINDVRHALALVDQGVGRQGIPARFKELLAPLTPRLVASGGQVAIEGGDHAVPPGASMTGALIEKLEYDKAYCEAYLNRWPTEDATNAYTLAPKRVKPVFIGGRRVERGEIIQLTEIAARANTNVLEPKAGTVPAALVEYSEAFA